MDINSQLVLISEHEAAQSCWVEEKMFEKLLLFLLQQITQILAVLSAPKFCTLLASRPWTREQLANYYSVRIPVKMKYLFQDLEKVIEVGKRRF